MLALVNGEPILPPCTKMLEVFLDFRVEIERRTLLRKAEERDHILLGLLLALDQLDPIIALIGLHRQPRRQRLRDRRGLSDIQADAILQMQLRRLTATRPTRSSSSMRTSSQDRRLQGHPWPA